jgi:hypothetical protein
MNYSLSLKICLYGIPWSHKFLDYHFFDLVSRSGWKFRCGIVNVAYIKITSILFIYPEIPQQQIQQAF